MRRSKGLRRGKRLDADPEKVREFMQRAGELKRSRPEGRDGGLKRKRPQRPEEGPLSPEQWRVAVYTAAAGRCSVTGTRADGPFDPDFEAHHALSKHRLRSRRLYAHVWDPRNGMFVTADVHVAHTAGDPRIPREALPPLVWEFAGEMDALLGTNWATDLIRREHPASGRRRTDRGGSDGEG